MIFRKDLLEIIGSSRSLSPMQINQQANRYLDKTRHEINSQLLEEFENRSYSDRNISYIDMLKIQKPDSIHFYEVISRRDTSFLYFDSNHFTQQGSLEFGERLRVSHPELFSHPSENWEANSFLLCHIRDKWSGNIETYASYQYLCKNKIYEFRNNLETPMALRY